MTNTVKKVLVVLDLGQHETAEKDASNNLQIEMKALLNFPCIFQVVQDAKAALNMTKLQYFDLIIVPQYVEGPITISDFAQTLVNECREDGVSVPPFICLLEDPEERKEIKNAKTEFLLLTKKDEIVYKDLSKSIIAALQSEIPVVEVENLCPSADLHRTVVVPVMAAATVVSVEPGLNSPKRARHQPAHRVTSQADEVTCIQPGMYVSIPVQATAHHGPSGPPQQGIYAPPPDAHWQAMMRQAQVSLQQHPSHPHMHPPPVYGPPPGYYASMPHQYPPQYGAPHAHQQAQQPHYQQQYIPTPHQGHAVLMPLPPVVSSRSQVTQQRALAPAPLTAHTVEYVPECPMSPTPKARTKKSNRAPTTTTGSVDAHTSQSQGRTAASQSSTQRTGREREDAPLVLPTNKNYLPFSNTLHTPERSPPVITPLSARGRTAEVACLEMEPSDEEDADEADGILRGSMRNTGKSPIPVIDPDLLSSMLHETI